MRATYLSLPALHRAAEESDYHLTYSEKGSRVCLVASEPVTGAADDWVEVPANTAVVVCREKGGILNILLAPLTQGGEHARHACAVRCDAPQECKPAVACLSACHDHFVTQHGLPPSPPAARRRLRAAWRR